VDAVDQVNILGKDITRVHYLVIICKLKSHTPSSLLGMQTVVVFDKSINLLVNLSNIQSAVSNKR
jgi:hypothetical protein